MSGQKKETQKSKPAKITLQTTQQLSDGDVRRIMDIVVKGPASDAPKTTLADLKAGAGDFGVSADALDRAYKILQREKSEQRGKRRKWVFTALFAVLLAWTGSAIYQHATRPAVFNGHATLTVTSEVKDAAAVDVLERVHLYSTRKIFALAGFDHLEFKHLVRYELVAKGATTPTVVDQTQIQNIADNYNVWSVLNLPWTLKPGKYTVRAFADDKLIAERPLEIDYGTQDLTMTNKIVDGEPGKAMNSYSQSKDGSAWLYVHWPQIKMTAPLLLFRWYDGAGHSLKTTELSIHPDGAYNAWGSVDLNQGTPGRWRVELILADVKIGETSFTVGE